MQQFFKTCSAAFLITLAAGCASTPSEPTRADAMRGHSDEAQRETDLKRELAERWERGDELERTGERRVERAQEQIAKAEENIREAREAIERGNREIVEGRELKIESERRFEARFPDLSLEPADQDLDR